MRPKEPKQKTAELLLLQIHLPLGQIVLSYHRNKTVKNQEQCGEREHQCVTGVQKENLALGYNLTSSGH